MGCAAPPRIAYRLTYPVRNAPGSIAVEMTLDHVARDHRLTFHAFATSEDVRFEDVRAFGASGRPLPVQCIASDPLVLGIDPPGTGRVRLEYVATPRPRGGDTHLGFTGSCASTLGARFGLVRGRDAFLLPERPERIRDIGVTFRLPPEWRAFAPWMRAGSANEAESAGPDAAEQLVGTPFAIGRLALDEFRVEATTFRVATDADLAAAPRRALLRELESVAADLFGRLGRSLGPHYTVLALARSDAGDEIEGDAWGTGQGGTLAPATPSRLREYARRVADGFLQYRPYRSEFRLDSDVWVASGLGELLAIEAVANARDISERDVDTYLAYRYGELPGDAMNVADVETLLSGRAPASERDRHWAETLVAPRVLRALVRRFLDAPASGTDVTAIAVASNPAPVVPGPAGGLDALARRIGTQRRIDSFWALLPESTRVQQAAFRRDVVRGKRSLPQEYLRDVLDVRATVTRDPGPATRRLRLLVTAQGRGFLENCGCKARQSGGLARRSTVLRSMRASRTPNLVLDVGSSIAETAAARRDAWQQQEEALYQSTVASLGYDAAGLGVHELARGPAALARMSVGPIPYTCANVRSDTVAVTPAYRIVRAGSVTCRVIGVVEPRNPLFGTADAEQGLDSLAIDDLVATVRRAVAASRPDELVIVLGELRPATLGRLAADCPRVDVVVTSQFIARGDLMPRPPDPARQPRLSGFLGNTCIVVDELEEYGVLAVDLDLTATARVARATFETHELDEGVPDDPAVRRRFNHFYDRVSATTAAAAAVDAPLAHDPERSNGRFVGAGACGGCHAAETEQWLRSNHSDALRTLVKAHRNYQPRCVACHVVAYGADTGYRIGAGTDHLGGVQCETCHGPGGAHVASPSRANIVRAVPERVCVSCHTADHSDDFVYAVKLPHVLHLTSLGVTAAARAEVRP